MEKMYISKVFAYRTPGEEGKGLFSVGMSVASRLNGDIDWVGTYNPNREYDGRKIGFITSPQKFGCKPKPEDGGIKSVTDEEWKAARISAEEVAEKMAKKYPRGRMLDPQKWAWGEPVEDAPEGTYEILFVENDVVLKQDVRQVRALALQDAVFDGVVSQPVE